MKAKIERTNRGVWFIKIKISIVKQKVVLVVPLIRKYLIKKDEVLK